MPEVADWLKTLGMSEYTERLPITILISRS